MASAAALAIFRGRIILISWFRKVCGLSGTILSREEPQRGTSARPQAASPSQSAPAGERSEPERVQPADRSAALSQKAALQLPFAVATPPVKMQCRSVRRRSGIALL